MLDCTVEELIIVRILQEEFYRLKHYDDPQTATAAIVNVSRRIRKAIRG